MHTGPRAFGRTIVTAIAIVAFCATLAFLHNALRTKSIPLIRPTTSPDGPNSDPAALSLTRAKEMFDQGILFVDSRTDDEFAQGHIKGARHIYYAHAEQQWEKAMDNLDWETPVVVYCSGEGCNSSVIVADFLRDMGYRKVFIFHGGWPAWSAAGYPVEGKPANLQLYEFK